MSAKLLGLAFDTITPTHASKLVLLKLVDACDDDGTNIFPAVATIARKAQCSPRQVQREIRRFVTLGLLIQVSAGGRGPGDTARYSLDVVVLRRIAEQGWPQEGDEAEEKGATTSPLPEGDTEAEKGDMGEAKGDKLSHPTPPINPSIDPSLERDARAREGEEGDHVPNADLLAELKGRAVRVSHDSPAAINAAWRRLTPAERREAVERYLDWVADAGGVRKAIAGLPTYLAEKRWTLLPPKAGRGAGGRFVAPTFSRDWWIIWHKRVAAGKPVGPMVEQARRGLAWGADPEPAEEEREAFVKVFVGSAEWEALAARVRAGGHGLLPRPDQVEWVFAPAEMLGEDIAAEAERAIG